MTRAFWILKVLLSHWRRRPFQAVTLFAGLAIATALWSGVQALNAQARASYDRAATVLAGDGRATVAARGGEAVAQEDYVALRRAGWPVSPIVDGDIAINGNIVRLMGIDPATLPASAGPLQASEAEGGAPDRRLLDFLVQPSLALAAGETIAALGIAEGARPDTDNGLPLPPVSRADELAPDLIVTDIGVAMDLLGRKGQLSRLVVTAEIDASLPRLAELAEGRLRLVESQAAGDLDRLTDSFHLNLTAFGFLAFLVGLFIVNAAIGLAFEQRRPMLRTLRACGVSARALTGVMLAELIAFAMAAGLVGIVAGYLIASALLPDVAASLRGLYGADVRGELTLDPAWWLAGIAMSVAGALAASASSLWRTWRLPLLATAQPQAWAVSQRRTLAWQAGVGLMLFAAAIVLARAGSGLVAGFALMGALLLGAALLLPAILAVVLALGERLSRGPIVSWFYADSRQQIGGLSLALMALLLALAVNIGVGTMVGSFRLTFSGWLDQRLASELYVGGDTEKEAADIAAWLSTREEVSAILPIWEAQTSYRNWPLEVYGFRAHSTYEENWPVLSGSDDLWRRAAGGEAVLVNEQMAHRFNLSVGDPIALPTQAGDQTLPIAGIYSDYGNPRGQVMLSLDRLLEWFPNSDRLRYALRVEPGMVPTLKQDLQARFGLSQQQLVDQASLKAFSHRVFERTFAVTLALNALTLGVAGAALLASLLGLAAARLPQIAPVWALGLTRRRLAGIELLRAIALALLTALVSLPLGLAVAWVLMNIINVQAFGWRLPLHVFPMEWLRLFGLAAATGLLAAAWPAFKLRILPPASLLKVFADER